MNGYGKRSGRSNGRTRTRAWQERNISGYLRLLRQAGPGGPDDLLELRARV